MIKLYVKYYYPGALFSEEIIKTIQSLEEIKLPDRAFGYSTFKREIIISPETGRECVSEPFDATPPNYPESEKYTLKQLEELFPEEKVLISNVKNNGWRGAIRARLGNWQAWEDE